MLHKVTIVAWWLSVERTAHAVVLQVGLLPKNNDENISFAYSKYIDTSPEGITRAAGFKAAFSRTVDIDFMGVWCVTSVPSWRAIMLTNAVQGYGGERRLHLSPPAIHLL